MIKSIMNLFKEPERKYSYWFINDRYVAQCEVAFTHGKLPKDIDTLLNMKSSRLTIFDPEENIFLKKISKDVSMFGIHIFNIEKITKEEHFDLLKNNICDCEVGSARNIVAAKSYNIEDELNKKYSEFIEAHYRDFSCMVDYYVYDECDEVHIVELDDRIIYKQKACIKCMKCLDGLGELYSVFEERLNKIKYEKDKRKKEIELVKMACGDKI